MKKGLIFLEFIFRSCHLYFNLVFSVFVFIFWTVMHVDVGLRSIYLCLGAEELLENFSFMKWVS